MYKKILVGVDESKNSKDAVRKAIEMKKEYGSDVVIFHSVIHHLSEINPSYAIGGSGALSVNIHQDYINLGKQAIKESEELFKEANLEVETRLVFDIPPEDYIKKTADEEDFDLVVLGCTGKHNKLERTFLGTVPEKVLNEAPCDVLIVR